MRLTRSIVALVAVLVLTAVSACNDDSKTGSDGEAQLEKVTYLTSFKTFGREAYAYVALEKGYFKDAGFEVSIRPGSGTVDVLKLVAGGQADYGIGDFTGTVITMAKQKLPVTTVGMIHQRSLAAIVALQGGKIKAPQDLAGANIGDQPGSTNTVMFPLYAKAARIPADGPKFIPSPAAGLAVLLGADKVDGIGQFVVGVPLVEKLDPKKRKAVVLPYGEKLPDLYGNAIVTRDDLTKDDPDQVKRFTGALLKGLQDAIDDPAAAAKILKKHVPDVDLDVATAELKLMKPYVKPAGFTGPLGEVDPARVERVLADLADAGQVPKGTMTPADVVNADLAPKG